MHQITVESYNKLGEREWSEVVKAATKPAAARKAHKVIRSCGEDVKIKKRQNVYDDTLETWRI